MHIFRAAVGLLTDLTIIGDVTVDGDTLYIDSADNSIGIGTLNPTAKLHIINDSDNQGDETADHGFKIGTGTTGQTLMFGYEET